MSEAKGATLLSSRASFLLGLGLVTLAAASLRIYALLDVPPSADDLLVVSSAADYVERGRFGPTMWMHPKLRNLLVYASLWLWGGSPWGLKAVSLSFGILSVPMLGLLARRLFGSPSAALLAALFLAVDPLHVDFSRQAIQEVFMPCFFVSAIYLALRYAEKRAPGWLVGSGCCFGLGLASKWYVLFSLVVTAGALLGQTLRAPRPRTWAWLNEVAFISASLLVIPATVYFLTFWPWFRHQGFGLSEWLAMQRLSLMGMANHSDFNPYGLELGHRPWRWFILPVGFADFVFDSGRHWVLLAIPNPLVWALSLPSMAYVAYRGLKERKDELLFLVALFVASYLPLLLASRPIWLHTSLSVIPYAFLSTAFMLTEVLRRRRAWLVGYVVAVAVTGFPLYLLSIGKGQDVAPLRAIIERYRPSFER